MQARRPDSPWHSWRILDCSGIPLPAGGQKKMHHVGVFQKFRLAKWAPFVGPFDDDKTIVIKTSAHIREIVPSPNPEVSRLIDDTIKHRVRSNSRVTTLAVISNRTFHEGATVAVSDANRARGCLQRITTKYKHLIQTPPPLPFFFFFLITPAIVLVLADNKGDK